MLRSQTHAHRLTLARGKIVQSSNNTVKVSRRILLVQWGHAIEAIGIYYIDIVVEITHAMPSATGRSYAN